MRRALSISVTAAALSYVMIAPVVMFIVPPIQRMVFRMAGIDPLTMQSR